MTTNNDDKFFLNEEGLSIVKSLRKKYPLTQTALGKEINASQATVSRICSKDKPCEKSYYESFFKYYNVENWEKYLVTLDGSSISQLIQHSLNTYYELPQSTAANFVGRNQKIIEINERLQSQQLNPVVVTGMPGIGKSELVLQYAWEYREEYLGGVVWIDARNEDIAAHLIQFAISCDIHPPDKFDIMAQLRYCCQEWNNSQELILIVLDDLDEYNQISPILPILPACVRLLVTTRRYFSSSLQPIILDALDADAAVKLLGSVMDAYQPVKRVEEEHNSALELCQFLGYLPLAIELVGRYLDSDEDFSIEELLNKIRQNALNSSILTSANPIMRVQRGIAEAFELSWERLPENAKRLGCFLALFSPSAISWYLVKDASEAQQTSLIPVEERGHLLSLYLLKKTGKGCYKMHRLLQEFFQIKLDKLGCGESLKRRLLKTLASHAEQLPERPNQEQISKFQELEAHIREAVPKMLSYADDRDFYPLFIGVCHFYQGQARYKQALEWSEQYLGIAQDRLGNFNDCIVKINRSIGCLYYFLGDFQEAEKSFQNALTLQKNTEDADDLTKVAVLVPLAALYRDMGKFEEAEAYAVQAVELREASLPPDSPDITESYMTLGTIYFHKGISSQVGAEKEVLLRKAEDYFLRVWERRKNLSQSNHPDIGESLNNLGVLYEHLEELEKAEEFHKKAINFNEGVYEETHPIKASSYNNLAKIYLLQEKYKESLDNFKIAEDIFKELDLPQRGWCRHNIALLYEKQGKQDEAKENVTLAYQILKETYKLPEDNPFLTRCKETYERIHQVM